MKFRNIPEEIEATQWFKNGDHPQDYAKEVTGFEDGTLRTWSGSAAKAMKWEGQVVRYYRRPDVPGETICEICERKMLDHGWIDPASNSDLEFTVCPGSWIITLSSGFFMPMLDQDFKRVYEQIRGEHPWDRVLLSGHKSLADKALIAALTLLSTQHDSTSEKRSFSHLTPEECFDKLVAHHDEISKVAV